LRVETHVHTLRRVPSWMNRDEIQVNALSMTKNCFIAKHPGNVEDRIGAACGFANHGIRHPNGALRPLEQERRLILEPNSGQPVLK